MMHYSARDERYCSVCTLVLTDRDDPDRVGYHPGRCGDHTGRMAFLGQKVPDQAFYGAVLELVREAEEVASTPTGKTVTLSTYDTLETLQPLRPTVQAPTLDSEVLPAEVPGRQCARCGKPSELMYCSGACKVAAHRAKP